MHAIRSWQLTATSSRQPLMASLPCRPCAAAGFTWTAPARPLCPPLLSPLRWPHAPLHGVAASEWAQAGASGVARGTAASLCAASGCRTAAVLRRRLRLTRCISLARDGTGGSHGRKAPSPCRHALSSVRVCSCREGNVGWNNRSGPARQALAICPLTHHPAPSSGCNWCRSHAAGSPPATFWPEAYMSSFNSSASTCAGQWGVRQLVALSFGVSACWRAGPLSRRART